MTNVISLRLLAYCADAAQQQAQQKQAQQRQQQQQRRPAGKGGAGKEGESAEGEGEAAPPVDDRTWLQKNWLIVMAGATMVSCNTSASLLYCGAGMTLQCRSL